MKAKTEKKKKVFRHLDKVALALLSVGLMTTLVQAVDPLPVATQTLGSEGGKAALNQALKFSRAKPSLAAAATIVCISCIPVAGAVASPAMCIACGILITKVID